MPPLGTSVNYRREMFNLPWEKPPAIENLLDNNLHPQGVEVHETLFENLDMAIGNVMQRYTFIN